jgi:hypothetical protein
MCVLSPSALRPPRGSSPLARLGRTIALSDPHAQRSASAMDGSPDGAHLPPSGTLFDRIGGYRGRIPCLEDEASGSSLRANGERPDLPMPDHQPSDASYLIYELPIHEEVSSEAFPQRARDRADRPGAWNSIPRAWLRGCPMSLSKKSFPTEGDGASTAVVVSPARDDAYPISQSGCQLQNPIPPA